MKVACVFPGQGSQAVGMFSDFLTVPAVAEMVGAADQALGEPRLSDLIAQGPAEDLALTTNTQPAMLLAGMACYQAWRDAGGPAAAMVAGHSLGEYTALVAAGSLPLAQAFGLTRTRAQAMQSAVPVGEGAMAAILGLNDAQVQTACDQAASELNQQVAPANFNAPSQVVIAGHTAAVEKACVLCKDAGARRAVGLPVSAPFHSALLEPAGAVLRDALAQVDLSPPSVPLVNNVDVASPDQPDQIRDALVRQAYSPVRWVEVVQRLAQMGATHVIEFGPGKVLTGLTGRIDKSLKSACVHDQPSLEKALALVAT